MKSLIITLALLLLSRLAFTQEKEKIDSLKIVIDELEMRQRAVEEKLTEARALLEKYQKTTATTVNSAPIFRKCPELIDNKDDKVTGKRITSAPRDVIIAATDDTHGIGMYWLLTESGLGKGLILVLKAFGGGCLDGGGKNQYPF
ncbi:MAG: hypothetical protein WDO15_06420 [Bacteroidota bacterium]